ncbi:hypothetical protein [Streptomyces sp. NPDC058308]|uniref:hypothetical protein n=1 Tax=Streptomyces sp. NPDC058308 TaxID=3346440 RepID=UPI0036EF4B93
MPSLPRARRARAVPALLGLLGGLLAGGGQATTVDTGSAATSFSPAAAPHDRQDVPGALPGTGAAVTRSASATRPAPR